MSVLVGLQLIHLLVGAWWAMLRPANLMPSCAGLLGFEGVVGDMWMGVVEAEAWEAELLLGSNWKARRGGRGGEN